VNTITMYKDKGLSGVIWLGAFRFYEAPTQLNAIYFFKVGFLNWWKISLCSDRHYECRPISAPPASSRNQNTSKKTHTTGLTSLNKIQYQDGFQNTYNPEHMASG